MNKPLGYYTNYIPNNKGLLHDIQERYGSYLQGITVREKLYLIQELSRDLSLRASGGEIRAEMHWLQYDLIKQLDPSDKEGMIQALIDQVRSL
ncbi:hypothetical protein [Calothrix sp. CCY 0018]|uniref:hypothetical protein n=1 Tax=Calothrix sp. CCY 0018 TaxID=3103864 RepID=UPI0039C6775E